MRAILACLLVAGCAIAPTFDPAEYNRYVEIHTTAVDNKQWCGDFAMMQPAVAILKSQTSALVVYTRYKPGNEDSHKMAQTLAGLADEMQVRYIKEKPSKAYCELKLDGIILGTQRALTAVGKEKK